MIHFPLVSAWYMLGICSYHIKGIFFHPGHSFTTTNQTPKGMPEAPFFDVPT